MEELVYGYKKSGFVSNKAWYENFVCGECIYLVNEECEGKYCGCERDDDSVACDGIMLIHDGDSNNGQT